MSPLLYAILTVLIGVITWVVLHAAWHDRLHRALIILIAVAVALVWPVLLLGLVVVSLLILINKPKGKP